MAEKLQVSSAYNAAGQPVNTVVTFTDGQNNKLELMGKPRTLYSLEAIVAGLADIQAPVVAYGEDTVTFTDANGGTLTITGMQGSSYDLEQLNVLTAGVASLAQDQRRIEELEAIVHAQGVLLTMMFGSNYEALKLQCLQGVK